MNMNIKSKTSPRKSPSTNNELLSDVTFKKKIPIDDNHKKIIGDSKMLTSIEKKDDFSNCLKRMMGEFRIKCYKNWDEVQIKTKANGSKEQSRGNVGLITSGSVSKSLNLPLDTGKTEASSTIKRMPLKEEAVLQKTELPPSPEFDLPRKYGSENPEGFPLVESDQTTVDFPGPPSQNPGSEDERRQIPARNTRRNKIIQYLIEIDEVEKATRQNLAGTIVDESKTNVDKKSIRDELLRSYGFKITSTDELVKYGRRAKMREKRKTWFPTNMDAPSSSSDGSDTSDEEPLDADRIRRYLKVLIGTRADDIDVNELVRHGSKWSNCLIYGCNCRPLSKEEQKPKEEKVEKNRRQFKKIYGKGTRDDLLRAHDQIGAWVHYKTKKLDEFIESGKYSPEYLLNIWDGHFSEDSSGDEPDFEKHRKAWLEKKEAYEREGLPIPSEDRVPTLEENSWFLFPTPYTRACGQLERGGLEEGDEPQPNENVVMDALVDNFQRSYDLKKATEFLEQQDLPMPHMYPRPEVFKVDKKNDSSANLTNEVPSTSTNIVRD